MSFSLIRHTADFVTGRKYIFHCNLWTLFTMILLSAWMSKRSLLRQMWIFKRHKWKRNSQGYRALYFNVFGKGINHWQENCKRIRFISFWKVSIVWNSCKQEHSNSSRKRKSSSHSSLFKCQQYCYLYCFLHFMSFHSKLLEDYCSLFLPFQS